MHGIKISYKYVLVVRLVVLFWVSNIWFVGCHDLWNEDGRIKFSRIIGDKLAPKEVIIFATEIVEEYFVSETIFN